MTSRICSLVLFSTLSILSHAQNRIKLLGVETGINFVESEMNNNGRIRASYSDYYSANLHSALTIQSNMYRVYGGVKAEIRSENNVFGLATGLRFSQVSNVLSTIFSKGYVYYMFRQTGTSTELLRVTKITQRTSYFSIPLEARVFPYSERLFRLYFLAGTELGMRLASKNKLEFHDAAMEEYENEAAEEIEEAGTFFSTAYGRVGLVIGKDKPFLDVGIMFPFVISNSATSLSDPGIGGGFHLQLVKTF